MNKKKHRIKWISIMLIVAMVTTGIPVKGLNLIAHAKEMEFAQSTTELETIWEEKTLAEETVFMDEFHSIVYSQEENEIITDNMEISSEDESAFGTMATDEAEGDSSEDFTQEVTEEYEELSTDEDFVINTEEPLGENLLPYVQVKDAYDLYLSLTLGVDETVDLPDSGDFYYVVTVTTYRSNGTAAVKDEFFFKKEKTSMQDVKIEMQNGTIPEGQEWTYDIAVTLVHTMLREPYSVSEISNKAIEVSDTQILNDISVTPYYEGKLSLKEGTKKIYTTQKDVAIATVKFSKKTTERDNLKVEDVTYATEENKKYALKLKEIGEDLVVYASADADTALGKHKIKVTASAPEHMYASEAFITVNVVQGIEEGMLSVVTPSEKLYKEENKAATLNFKVQYGKDMDTLKAPNKKKITWEILSPEGRIFEEGDALYGMITMKDGLVTVKKKYVISEKPQDNRFMVKVSAADFKGNPVCVYSEVIEVVAQAKELGEVVIVKNDDDGIYTVTGRSEATITSDQLGCVRVLKADAPLRDSYTSEELAKWAFEPQYLTYKTNNSFLKIEKDGKITATKPVKNVKITVVANDKSKSKAELKNLTIAYEEPLEIALRVEKVDKDGNLQQVGDIQAKNTNMAVNATADCRYLLTVMQRFDKAEEWEAVDSYVNFNLTLQNGKIIRKSGSAKQFYEISTTKEKMTIKLTNKAQKNNVVYTITNTTFPKGKLPKLTTQDKLKAIAYEKEQQVVYTLKKNGSFKYDFARKTVLITVDNSDKFKNEANEARYNAFEQVVSGLGYQPVDNGTVMLDFVTSKETPLPAGNYKLWFTFGTLDTNGDFRPDTAAKAVNLKANNVQVEKGSYTPNRSYKMAVKEGGTVKLTGTGKRFLKESVTFFNLRNANVNGAPNEFRTYFELTDNVLKLKDDLTETQVDYITSSKAKNDWTCHLDYSAMISNTDGSYQQKSGTIKVQITMVDSVRKITFNTVSAPDDKTVVSVNTYANSKKVNITHAYATAGSYTATCDGTSKLVLTPKTGAEKPKGGENKVTIYIVPEGTYQANKDKLDSLKTAWDNASDVDKATAEKTYVSALKKYGIKAIAKVMLPVRIIENRELSEKVVKLVNEERAKIGLKPLSINDDVMYAAFIRAKEISVVFDHKRPDGRSCFTVLSECGVSYRTAGENIAYGYSTPEGVMDGWMNSSGHRANILYSSFTEIGVGCYEYNGRLYWVQMFIG